MPCPSPLGCSNQPWHWAHGLSLSCIGHYTLMSYINHPSKSVTFVVAPSCHDIAPMTLWTTLVHKVECLHASFREGEATPHPMPLRPHEAHHECHGAPMCMSSSYPSAMVMPHRPLVLSCLTLVPILSHLPSLPPFPSPPFLEVQFKPFWKFLDGTCYGFIY